MEKRNKAKEIMRWPSRARNSTTFYNPISLISISLPSNIYSLLPPFYRGQDSMFQNIPWMSNNPMMQQVVLQALELKPGMIKWMMSDPNIANLMGGILEHGMSQNTGVDLFASGQREIRA